jgi:hypothetical protein
MYERRAGGRRPGTGEGCKSPNCLVNIPRLPGKATFEKSFEKGDIFVEYCQYCPYFNLMGVLFWGGELIYVNYH